MMKKIYILIFILMMIFIPKECLAAAYITGNQTVFSGHATLKGDVTCSASGTVTNASSIKESGGECDGGGTRHGKSNYCCDSAHNSYDDCVKPASGCDKYKCVGGKGGSKKGSCEAGGGLWLNYCTSPESAGTKTNWIKHYSVNVGATGKGTCGSGTVTCRGAKEGSISSSFETFASWKATSVNVRSSNILPGKGESMYNNGGCASYGGESYDGIWIYSVRYNRCCGASSEAAHNYKPAEDEPKVMGCWRRQKSSSKTLFGTEDNYEYKWDHVGYSCTKSGNACVCGKDKDGKQRCNSQLPGGKSAGWQLYKVEGSDMNEKLCETQKPAICSVAPPSEFNEQQNAKYCSQKDVFVPFNEDIKCNTNDSTFYEIQCTENASANYNPDKFEKVKVNGVEDEKIAVLQPGQGFGFNVDMHHERSCEGKFNSDIYNKTYQKILDLLRRAESMFSGRENDDFKREYAWYGVHKDELDNISKSYEDQYLNIVENGKYLFNYDGKLSFEYMYKKSKNVKTVELLMEEEENIYLDNGKPKYTKTHKLKNGKTVYDFSYKLTQESLLKPKQVYFDKNDGSKEVAKTETNGAVDGGQMVYTELKTDLTNGNNYKINTSINIYKSSSPSKVIATINNNKCEIEVYEDEVKYRIIDVTNPFVNSARKIPWNWNSYSQNYTKTIKSDIWSEKPLYQFDLPKENISRIKISNSNDNNAYLGTCNKSQSLQDAAIRSYCTIINSK